MASLPPAAFRGRLRSPGEDDDDYLMEELTARIREASRVLRDATTMADVHAAQDRLMELIDQLPATAAAALAEGNGVTEDLGAEASTAT
jgi:hypothetical protein